MKVVLIVAALFLSGCVSPRHELVSVTKASQDGRTTIYIYDEGNGKYVAYYFTDGILTRKEALK